MTDLIAPIDERHELGAALAAMMGRVADLERALADVASAVHADAVDVVFSSSTSSSFVIDFPAGKFTISPAVVCQVRSTSSDADGMTFRTTAISATQATVLAVAAASISGTFAVDVVAAEPIPNPPGPPTAVAALAGDAEATVTWSDGSGSDDHDVEYRVNAGAWLTAATDVANGVGTHTQTGLTNGDTIRFRVRAENTDGASAWVESADVVPNDPGPPVTLDGEPIMATAYVYRDATNTIAIERDGTVIQSLATSAANNPIVIQAAIDFAAGAYDPGSTSTLGYGGGGLVELSADLFEIAAAIELKYGTSLKGQGCAFDRNGFVETAHSMQGTVIAPTSALPTIDIEDGGGTTNRRPAILVGRSTGGSGSQSTTNPHGAYVRDLGVWMGRADTGQGVLIADTQYVKVYDVVVNGANGAGGCGIEILSTNSPDDGAHANEIRRCWLNYCSIGLNVNGSGSTDGMMSECRLLQCDDKSAVFGASGGGGGWQISGNHFTAGSGEANPHVDLASGPHMVTNNYFDTSGGYDITCDTAGSTISGNYFKGGSGGGQAFIQCTGNGKRVVVVGNFGQAGPNTDGFIEFNDQSGDDFRPVCIGNTFGNGGNSPNGFAVNSAGVDLGEYNNNTPSGFTGTANAIVKDNNLVASAL